MNCLTPIRVHIGTPSEALVPCGKCGICRQNYRNMWITRLKCENLTSDFSFFITLTYDNDHLPFKDYVDVDTGEVIMKPIALKRDIQLFLKRLRKIYPEQVRYFVVSEYGEKTFRPHWHMLLFIRASIFDKLKFYDDIKATWQNGNVMFGDVSPGSITYVCKYILKISKTPLGVKDTVMLCSRRPAIGSHYILTRQDFAFERKNFNQLHFGGETAVLPRLFRDKFKSSYLDEFGDDSLDDENRKLSFAIQERDRKLKEEFEKSYFEDFSEFIRWKSQQYSERQKQNVVKHDKL